MIPSLKDVQAFVDSSYASGLPHDAFVLVSGSLGRGEGHPGSDIDLIISDESNDNHTYFRKSWKSVSVDLNLTNIKKLKLLCDDPDWENMVADSKVLHDPSGKGRSLVCSMKDRRKCIEHRRRNASLYCADAIYLISECINSNSNSRFIINFDAIYHGIIAVCMLAGLPKGGYYSHMENVKNAAEITGVNKIAEEYFTFHGDMIGTFEKLLNDLENCIEIIRHELKANSNYTDKLLNRSIEKTKTDSIIVSTQYLEKTGKIFDAHFLIRRYILSLILGYSRVLLKSSYKQNRRNSIEIVESWNIMPSSLQELVLNLMPRIEGKEAMRFLGKISSLFSPLSR